jgi:hypothetical protein
LSSHGKSPEKNSGLAKKSTLLGVIGILSTMRPANR